MAAYEQEQKERIDLRDSFQVVISKAEQVYDNAQIFLNLIQKYTDTRAYRCHSS